MVSMPWSMASVVVRIVDLLAAEVMLPLVIGHRAGEHLDQRRLAGAVVAEQADDLALADDEGHVARARGRGRSTW